MDLIPNSGFSLTSLVRGLIGMLSLLFIAYLLSKERKQIEVIAENEVDRHSKKKKKRKQKKTPEI